jgi:four helix bundle protein
VGWLRSLVAGGRSNIMANGNLIVGNVALEMVEALQPLVSRIKRQDRSLADQLVRAATSVVLNVAEADYSDPGNKRSRLFTAAGSANEVRAAVKLAVAWKYCPAREVEHAQQLLDRVIAMLWRLTRGLAP